MNRPGSMLLMLFFVVTAFVAGGCSGDDEATDPEVTLVAIGGDDEESPAGTDGSGQQDDGSSSSVETSSTTEANPSTTTTTAQTTTTMPDPTLVDGAEGRLVGDVQDRLNDFLGLADLNADRIAEDGFYGPNTVAMQEAFERYAGLEVDGQSSPEDREQLDIALAELEESAAASVIQAGDTSEPVGFWQDRLNDWLALIDDGPDQINTDNVFGPGTEEATRFFEQRADLQVDGIVEPEDRVALRNAITAQRADSDVTSVLRESTGSGVVLVKAFRIDDRFCVRAITGPERDEACSPLEAGQVMNAEVLRVEGQTIIAGIATAEVTEVILTGADTEVGPLVASRIGDSETRAWAVITGQTIDQATAFNRAGDEIGTTAL